MIKRYFFLLFLAVALLSCKDETKVTGVTLDPTEMTLAIGETRQIEMVIEPLSAHIYNQKYWSSSNENVAVVDERGNVTGVYAGTCTITASAGGIKATCQVTVATPTYDIRFDNAIVFNNGIDEESGSNVKILRLYEDDITIDSTGNVSGNGLMLNIFLFSNATTEPLIEGTYQLNDSRQPFTILPGEIKEKEGTTYATGSFLGQYSDYGLSVLFARTGLMRVSKEGTDYAVECVMEGSLNEHIEARFSGKIAMYRSDTTYQVEELYYDDVEMSDTLIESETMLRHTKLTFKCGSKKVEMILRLPKSSKERMKEGRYTLSNKTESYTIMTGAKIDETEILQGTMDVTKNEKGKFVFNGSFRTEDGSVKLSVAE